MKLTFKLPLAFAAALFLMFAGAMYGLYAMHRSIDGYNDLVRVHVANERMASSILVNFKLQVQEWKDILLRGKDPAKFDKGWAAFQKQESIVDTQTKALLASLEPFANHGVNLLKIESRPIHGKPFEYQFYVDVEAANRGELEKALAEVREATSALRVLGLYVAAKR